LADPLTSDERRKLVAILSKATGSDSDHEKLVALGMAHQLLGRHGLLWADLLSPSDTPPATQTAQPRTYRDVARDCLGAGFVSDWEEGFLLSLILKGRAGLSPKQESCLRDIADKFGVAAWGAVP
jgi:hypothetical protein